MAENKYISVVAHVLRFGGVILGLIGLILDILFAVGFGENTTALLLYMISFFVMAAGIALEAFYHVLEGEWLA